MAHAADTEPIALLTTVASQQQADCLARALVESRLAACVQTLPIRSTYRWEGAVTAEPEVLLLIKSTSACRDELERQLLTLHPYQTPELLRLSLNGGSAAYLDWLSASVAPTP